MREEYTLDWPQTKVFPVSFIQVRVVISSALNVCDAGIWRRFSGVMKRCVDSNIFQRGILFAILINTLSMGIEHHNQVACRFHFAINVFISKNH